MKPIITALLLAPALALAQFECKPSATPNGEAQSGDTFIRLTTVGAFAAWRCKSNGHLQMAVVRHDFVSDGGASRFKRSIPAFAALDLSSASSWDSGIGKSALIASSGTINTATSPGTWRQFKVGHYDNAASGSPTAPDWATHEWIEFNTTSVVPATGSSLIYFDDLYIGRM